MRFANDLISPKIQPTTCFKKLLPTEKLFKLTASCFGNYLIGMGLVGDISKNSMCSNVDKHKLSLSSVSYLRYWILVTISTLLTETSKKRNIFFLDVSDEARCYLRYSQDFKFEPRSVLLEHLTKSNFTDPDPTFATSKEGLPGNACWVGLNKSVYPFIDWCPEILDLMQGDSGSGFYLRHRFGLKYRLLGLVIKVPVCIEKSANFPRVFVSPYYHKQWIKNVTGRSFDC